MTIYLKDRETSSSAEREITQIPAVDLSSSKRRRNLVHECTERSTDVATSTGVTQLSRSCDLVHRCLYRPRRTVTLTKAKGWNHQANWSLVKVENKCWTKVRYNTLRMVNHSIGYTALTSRCKMSPIYNWNRSLFTEVDPELYRQYRQTQTMAFTTPRIWVLCSSQGRFEAIDRIRALTHTFQSGRQHNNQRRLLALLAVEEMSSSVDTNICVI